MTRPLRVRILTHYFPPEVGAPQARLAALAAGLAATGMDVSVHTGFPHYPAGRIPPPYRNRLLARETMPDGVRVLRSVVWSAANRGFAGRLTDHLAFAGGAVVTAGAGGPVDVVIAESPPLFLAASAVAYARAKRAALVLHIADLWPESAVELGALRHRRAIAAAAALASFAYRHSALIVVPTEGMAAALAARGVTVRQIPPAVDLDRFAAIPSPAPQAPLQLLYAGTVGLAAGLETLVDAARIAGPERLSLTIAGDGAEAASVRAAARDLEHVRLLGAVPAGRIPALYAAAHAGVVLLRDRPVFASALPTKLLEVMASARPVVLAARGESAALVERTGAGVVVAPEDPQALAEACAPLADDPAAAAAMGARGRAAVVRDFGREAMLDRWVDVVRAVQRARL